MFRSIVLSACLAGLCAGSVLTLVQQPTVAPIILAAEVYESHAALEQASHAATGTPAGGHQHGDSAHDAHGHGAAAWAPENGVERTFWSLMTNVGAAIGFALLLCAVYALLPRVTATRGLLWGLAGFVVFFANPGIGLHPEIPGTMSANLFDRQLWWLFTALVSALAVALIAWRRLSWTWTWAGAVVLLAVPHVIGAPQPAVHASAAPQVLAQQFIWATVFVNAVFWLTLGAISALAFRRFAALPESP